MSGLILIATTLVGLAAIYLTAKVLGNTPGNPKGSYSAMTGLIVVMRRPVSRPASFALAAIALSIGGCGKSTVSWTEEVQVNGRDTFLVNRTVKTKSFGELGGPGGWENMGMTLEIKTPKQPGNPPVWSQELIPMILDRDPKTKQWFVVATTDSCQKWYALGRPKQWYFEFRVQDDQWVQHALSNEHIGREANMLTSINSSGEKDLTLRAKAERMSDPMIGKKYKQVLDSWISTC